MTLLRLPGELLLAVTSFLEAESDINFLSRTNTRLHAFTNPYLYQRNAQRSNSSALLWAANHGHEATAKFSLRGGANVGVTDSHGRTPLIIACELGYVGVVELLVAQDGINLNGMINDWSPPDPDLHPSRRQPRTMSPLLFAAGSGRADVVKLLLNQPGVNLRFTDCWGRSVLNHATKDGCESVLKLLLADNRTRTCADGPLVLYAYDTARYSAMLLLLRTDGLELDLYPDEADRVLNGSLDMGFSDVVKTLLLLPSPLTESRHLYEWTSLLASAVVHGDKEAVATLLANPEVDANCQDAFLVFTPLSLAVCMENKEIVQLLLAVDHVDPNLRDKTGRSPLWIAASLGYAELVKLLLGKAGIDVNLKDRRNQTPLTIASERGYATVVRLLLAQDDIEPDIECDQGLSAMRAAVYLGHCDVAGLLLKSKKVNLNGEKSGRLLFDAVLHGHMAMVELLLATDGVDPNSVEHFNFACWTHPLSLAVVLGNLDIVKRLLLRQDIDVNCTDGHGHTPLDQTEVVNCVHSYGPLDKTTKQRIVEILLAKGALYGKELRSLKRVSE